MSYKFLLPFIFTAAFLTACQTTETTEIVSVGFSRPSQEPVQTQPTQATRTLGNKELILNFCQMTPQECECFANQLSANLSQEEWNILRAIINQDDEQPAGYSENNNASLQNKMKQAVQTCSR